MNGMEIIKMRRSIRDYSDQEIEEEKIHQILEAGMIGPSCANTQDWCFIVVQDSAMLEKMADANGRAAGVLRGAKLGILVCGDLNKSFKNAQDYWIIDGAIACENMLLAATELKIGSVCLGTYPQMERVNAQKELFDLPDNIIPHSILAFGYPKDPEELKLGSRSTYDESKVHFGKW